MSDIKKHLCPNCGGNLIVDNDKQMYTCESCGSTYDYSYFKEEEMHETGDKYLQRGEFMAAADAYKFTLNKNPHDFHALRGLMLAVGGLKSIDEMSFIHREKTKDFEYDTEVVSKVIEGALEEDKRYFEDWGNIYFETKKVSDLKGEVESLKAEKRRIEDKLRDEINNRTGTYSENEMGMAISPKMIFILLWAGIAAIICFSIPFCIGMFSVLGSVAAFEAVCYSAFIVIVMLIGNMVFVFPKVRTMKKANDVIPECNNESKRLDEKISELENEVNKLTVKINVAGRHFTEKDKQFASGK